MLRDIEKINRSLATLLVSFTLIISVFAFKQILEDSGEFQNVKGVTTSSNYNQIGKSGDIKVELVDNGLGVSTIYLYLSKPIRIAGAELYFEVSDNLQIFSIECFQQFSCINASSKDQMLTIRALRPPELANTNLVDMVKIGDVIYNPSTSGSLKINTPSVKDSVAIEVGESVNLINGQQKIFIINQ